MRKTFALIALSLVLTVTPATANSLREMPLAEQTEQSELIVVGRVVSMDGTKDHDQWAVVDVRATIKGESAAQIKVLTIGEIAERNYPDCRPGDEYVLFLFKSKTRDNLYVAVAGRYSFVRLKP